MEKEYTFSKLEIATFLRDALQTMAIWSTKPDINAYQAFALIMSFQKKSNNITAKYYTDMLYVSQFYALSKSFFVIKDNTLSRFVDFLREDDITTPIPDSIFINPSDRRFFSNKKIITFVRNAICHSDKDKSLYKLKKIGDDIYIEIELSEVEPVPFHIQITIKDFCEIMSNLFDAKRLNIYHISENKNPNGFPFKFDKYYATKGIKNLTKHEISVLKTLIQETKDYAILDEPPYDQIFYLEEIPFTKQQTVSYHNEIASWTKSWKHNNFLSADKPDTELAKYVAKKHSFLPIFRSEDYARLGFILVDFFLRNVDQSSHEILEEAYRDDSLPAEEKWRLLDHDYNINLISMLYAGFMFDSMISDPFIYFQYKRYSTEHIRNSFVHSRFITSEQFITLKDWEREDGEYDMSKLSFCETFDVSQLLLKCDEYYNKELSKKTSPLFDFVDYKKSENEDD